MSEADNWKQYDETMMAMLPILNEKAEIYGLRVIYKPHSSTYQVLNERDELVYIGSSFSVLSWLDFQPSYGDY